VTDLDEECEGERWECCPEGERWSEPAGGCVDDDFEVCNGGYGGDDCEENQHWLGWPTCGCVPDPFSSASSSASGYEVYSEAAEY